MSDRQYILVGEPGFEDEHRIGNHECRSGWCDGRDYPQQHECGGLIHANFGDENQDCEYWLYTKCDRCGEEGNP